MGSHENQDGSFSGEFDPDEQSSSGIKIGGLQHDSGSNSEIEEIENSSLNDGSESSESSRKIR